jgi:hypothetical protein
MRIHIVACRVLTRELSALVAKSKNRIDISWLPQGMHDTPEILHRQIEAELGQIYTQIDNGQLRHTPEYIVLGYGLCSNATVNLTATRIALVVPRTDDCIALFLGSQARYLDYFNAYPGTYWLNSDWVSNMPSFEPDYLDKLRTKYMEEYDDEDTVDYLMGVEHDSVANYKTVGYIDTATHDDAEDRALAQGYARRFDLEFRTFSNDSTMLEKMVAGDFDEKSFLIVKPGFKVAYSNGPERIIAVPA